MQLTLYSDYSLRVLIYLGLRPHQLCTITEIAEAYGISRNHLVKVVHNLGMLGWIDTARGRGGGMALSRPADQINIGAVVRQTEPGFTLVECFEMKTNTCPIAPVCVLKGALQAAQTAFLQVLDSYTLADLLKNAGDLTPLLKK